MSVIIMAMSDTPTPTPTPSKPPQEPTPTATAFKRPASVDAEQPEQVTTVTESPATDEQPAASVESDPPPADRSTPSQPAPQPYDPAADMPRRIMARLEAIENDPAAYVRVMNVSMPCWKTNIMRHNSTITARIEHGEIVAKHYFYMDALTGERYAAFNMLAFDTPQDFERMLHTATYDPYNPPEIAHDAPTPTPTPTPTSVESEPHEPLGANLDRDLGY